MNTSWSCSVIARLLVSLDRLARECGSADFALRSAAPVHALQSKFPLSFRNSLAPTLIHHSSHGFSPRRTSTTQLRLRQHQQHQQHLLNRTTTVALLLEFKISLALR